MRPPILALTGAFLCVKRDPVSALSFLHQKADRHRRPRHGAGVVQLAGRSSSKPVEASRASSTTALYGQHTTEQNHASSVQVTQWKHVPASPPTTATPPSSMAARSSAEDSSGSSYKEGSDRGGGGTPLARFNNLVNYERYGDSDDQGVLASTLEINSTESDSESGAPGPSSASSPTLVVNFMDLMGMAFKSATSIEMQKKRRDLVRQVKLHGGYCVVEMDQDDVEARILDHMWDLMGSVLDPTRADDESAEGSPHALRRQVLNRNADNATSASASENPGYDFVQTTLVENSIRPLWIEERHGPLAAQHAQQAYMLLAQLCKAFATIVYAGSVGTTPENATCLIQSLLDDQHRPFSGSYHRWCRYVPLRPPPPQASTPEKIGWGESLRPHVDWTISTAIPVSEVAGLEVYDPSLSDATTHHEVPRRWVRVEEVVHDYWKSKQSARDAASASDEATTPNCPWNAHYVVVFAGAWLELLTEGEVKSTLHRVVSRRDASLTDLSLQSSTPPRLSAPFFMRPKELVFQTMDRVFDDPSRDDVARLDANEAVREMSQFLRESELLRAPGTTASSQ